MPDRTKNQSYPTSLIPKRARRKTRKNIGNFERGVSVLCSSAFATAGIGLRGVARYSALLLSAEFLRRAVTGTSFLYRVIGLDRSRPSRMQTSERSITILRPRAEVYSRWRNFEKYPEFMEQVVEVGITGKRLSHWVAQGPRGAPIDWDAEVINEKKNEFIHWRTVRPRQIKMQGKAVFLDAPQGKGTELHVTLNYEMLRGRRGKQFASMFGKDPDQQNRENLRRFKRLVETGEIPTAETTRPQMVKETIKAA